MMSENYLGFSDRMIVLVRASIEELSRAVMSLDDVAELRRPHDVASFLTQESSVDQALWVKDLLDRVLHAPSDAPAACIIDTGVQQNHPLLSDSLHETDVHTISGLVGKVRERHGTEMAGLALYGDLEGALSSSLPVALHHRLESVKFLKDGDRSSSNGRELYGAVTAQAVDLPEIQAPNRRRVFSIATTSPRVPFVGVESIKSHDPGKPTSWSATIDALAAGYSIDYSNPPFTYLNSDERDSNPRLFVLSAGNINDVKPLDDHLSRSDLEPVEDPAQAWNAITVGAFTNLDDMSGAIPSFDGYVPIAQRGELAPTSRTSVVFDSSKWPVKPDVVAEGGNVARTPDGTSVDTPENLAILTTRLQQSAGQGAFTTTRDTSAATAQVTSIAADVMSSYPEFWPETVRALVIHSAEWTPQMKKWLDAAKQRGARSRVLRRYGLGVPDLARALNSAADALTLVSQATIRPFEHQSEGNEGRAWEMNLHELPWPSEVLEGLGEAQVKMRITLSYFIQPNPSNRGWTGRYTYPSHGLRFAVRRATESTIEFRKRINTQAREEKEKIIPSDSDSEQWFFGPTQQQSAGSLHTDIWSGDASDLAQRGVLAVYPVGGWWKHNKLGNRSEFGVRYSLIVSIETPELGVDVWTPVYQKIQTTVPIVI